MKLFRLKFAACFLVVGFIINSTSAETVIYTDNFNITDTNKLDDTIQTGRHTGLLFTNVVGRSGGVQHTITNNMLNLLRAPSNASGRMRFHDANNTANRYNWATNIAGAGSQILTDTGMKISFDWTAQDNTSADWISYSAGVDSSDQATRVTHAGTDSGILMRNNGGYQVFRNGAGGASGAAGAFDVSSLTRHVDLYYFFSSWSDGAPVVLAAYVNTNLIVSQTFTWAGNLGTNHMEIASLANGTKIDNFTVTSLPLTPLLIALDTTANPAAPNYVGRPVTLSAILGGSGPITYQWKVDKGSGFVDVPNATNSTVTFSNALLSDSGLYSLFATNSAGNTNTASLSLAITDAILIITNTTADSPTTNYEGHPVNLSATIGGSLPITYQWKVDKGSGFVNVSSSATNATMALLNPQISDSGLYSLFATNSGGSTNTASLSLTFITAPAPSTLTLLNVQYTGETPGGGAPGPAGTQNDGAVIGSVGDVWNPIFSTSGSYTAGTGFTCTNAAPIYLKHSGNIGTLNTLTFVADYIHNGGQGTFANTSVSNLMTGLLGMQSARTGTVTVSNLAAGTYDLYIYGVNAGGQTRSSTFNANGTTAVCGPNRSATPLIVQSNYVHLVPTVTASGTLTITFAGAADGNAQLNGFQLSGPLALPTLSLSQDTTVGVPGAYVGYTNDVTFTAGFGGTQPITNQWKVDKGSGFVAIAGATNNTLVLTNVQVSDTGTYALFASNPAGSSNSTPTLFTVLPLSNITLNVQFVGSAFGGGNAPTQVGDAVIGSPSDIWNTVSNPNGDAGTPAGRANATNRLVVAANNFGTTVKMDYVADYVFSGAFAGSGPFLVVNSSQASLMTGYMGTVNSDTNTVILRNLAAGPYDLYVYSSGRSDGQSRITKFTANGVTATCGPNSGNSSLIAGVNYVHLTPTIGVDGLLKVTMLGLVDAGQGLMNGFQLNGPVTSYNIFMSSDTSSDSPATNFVGRTVTLSAGFGGNPTPSLQWKVDKGSGFVNVSPSATNDILTLVNVQVSDTGSYSLFASNFVNVLNSTPVTMAVIPKPTNIFSVNLNVQFVGTSRGSGTAATQTGPASVGNGGDYWNPVANPNPVNPNTDPIHGAGQILTDAANVGSSMTLDYTGTADFNSGVDNPFYFSGSPAENLMKAALVGGDNTNATVTVHGILPGTYDLYLYSSGNFANQANVTLFTANGVTAVAGPNNSSAVLAEGVNYVHLTTTVTGNGLLNISFAGTNTPASQLNGFQLAGPSVLLPPDVVLDLQRSGSQLTLTWPNGTLLESTNILGPWTTNNAPSPYTFTITNTIPEKYFRVLVQ